MRIYTDYDFYKNAYKGTMPENDFDRLVIRASYVVRRNIFDRDIIDYEDEVQLATCSVADILLEIERIEGTKSKLASSDKNDRVLSSEQVADLHKTFANTTNISDLDTQISDQKEKIVEELKKYLSDTGLLYRGV